MDDIGSILYIIISIIFVIVGAARKAKKKVPSPVFEEQPEQRQSNPMDEFEEFVRRFKQEESIAREQDLEEEDALEPAVAVQEPVLDTVPVEEGVSTTNKYQAYLEGREGIQIDDSNTDNEILRVTDLTIQRKNKMNLKKAIVYNAILERKYK
ncbi:MAG: hypothetical protein HC896_04690 [Bacteroidales bacterium]|nr:hypothetical protein [Bacteroidales bacterium]